MAAAETSAWQRTRRLQAIRAQRSPILSFLLPQSARISDDGLKALDEHKYRPGPYTPIDLLLYRIWWQPLAELLPRWLAPNALTLVGMAAVLASAALLLVFSPTLEEATPPWAELLVVLLLTFYQTCDALDGLQARRTGASSPLGELLDHGCDSVCLSAITLGYCASEQYGLRPLTLGALCVSWVPWWAAQWEAYHTGIVRTGSALFGITEIQFVVNGIHIITAIFGNGIWGVAIVGSFDVRTLCVFIQMLVAATLSTLSVVNVVGTTRSRLELALAARRALPLVVLVGGAGAWSTVARGAHIPAMCAAACALFARIASEIVLRGMTQEPYPGAQPTVAALPALLALAALGLLDGAVGSVATWAYAAYCAADAAAFIADVLVETSTHLGASFLFLTPGKSR